jgi:hypothetical protein
MNKSESRISGMLLGKVAEVRELKHFAFHCAQKVKTPLRELNHGIGGLDCT